MVISITLDLRNVENDYVVFLPIDTVFECRLYATIGASVIKYKIAEQIAVMTKPPQNSKYCFNK